jgi:hypothetical protein
MYPASSTYTIRSMDKPDGVINSSLLQTIRLAPRPRNLPRVVGAFLKPVVVLLRDLGTILTAAPAVYRRFIPLPRKKKRARRRGSMRPFSLVNRNNS